MQAEVIFSPIYAVSCPLKITFSRKKFPNPVLLDIMVRPAGCTVQQTTPWLFAGI